MHARRHSIVTALALSAALLSACAGEPEPIETTPLFASEDEAFAAAEETYRAYVDALNQVDLSDPETFEPVFALTTGELNASDRTLLSEMHADDLTVTGDSSISALNQRSIDAGFELVQLEVCLDVSGVDVLNADGASTVSETRSDVQSTLVVLRADKSTRDFLLESVQNRDQGLQCA